MGTESELKMSRRNLGVTSDCTLWGGGGGGRGGWQASRVITVLRAIQFVTTF